MRAPGMVGLLGLRVRMERGADDEELANANCSGLGRATVALDLAFFLGGDGELPSSLIFFVRDLGMAGVHIVQAFLPLLIHHFLLLRSILRLPILLVLNPSQTPKKTDRLSVTARVHGSKNVKILTSFFGRPGGTCHEVRHFLAHIGEYTLEYARFLPLEGPPGRSGTGRGWGRHDEGK
ncbi:hypothetical protein FA13DRAFT_866080 [Coprinellus micaceus]|uniref:Uncharacterized protein n=1 Tax=Coprinellus micaceus TaxID=71717 RepID=A0A4Y7S2H5_COPMI|nr:hypothetical protein FA13DRAFT_866080 [Coprinellus micaceus]